MAREAGRDEDGLTMSMRLDVALAGTPVDPRHPATLTTGEPAELADALAAYGEAGMEHAVIAFSSGDVGALEEGMRVIAAEVAPRLR